MTLPTYDQAWKTAHDEPAFSNGTEGHTWLETHCERCINDSPELVDRDEGCPLILVSLMGRTPAEWTPDQPGTLGMRYRCMYFRSEEDGGDPEPKPIPDPPGQLTLAPREPFERPARMLAPLGTPQPVEVA